MQQSDFNYIASYIKNNSGIMLTQDKSYLVSSRLSNVAKHYHCNDISQFISKLKMGINSAMKKDIIEAMTTNESLFFRDGKPFDYIKESMLDKCLESKSSNDLRIWSAASSNGQEAYSLAIIAENRKKENKPGNISILATDIDSNVVAKASSGNFTNFEVQRGLSPELRNDYFIKDIDNSWTAKKDLKNHIKFDTHNLTHNASRHGKFDIILCRYVLIYFDKQTKTNVVNNISNCLNPGGYLVLGTSEFIPDCNNKFDSVNECRGIYRKA